MSTNESPNENEKGREERNKIYLVWYSAYLIIFSFFSALGMWDTFCSAKAIIDSGRNWKWPVAIFDFSVLLPLTLVVGSFAILAVLIGLIIAIVVSKE